LLLPRVQRLGSHEEEGAGLAGERQARRASAEEREKAMSLYKRGDVWWYKFRFAGQMIRESSKSESRTLAKEAERVRRRQLEESWNQIKRRKLPPLFSVAANEWLHTRTGIAPGTERSYKLGIAHLSAAFGKHLLCDISGPDVSGYQKARQRDGIAGRTINMEVGVLRAILRRYRLWEAIAPDVDFLKENPSPGRALTADEETALLRAAQESRCRSLYPVVMLALNTGLRASEIRGLTWERVDFLSGALTVGKSKTAAGTGRIVPLNPRAAAVLTHWRAQFPNAQPEHYVFPHEKYGLAGNDRQPCAWGVDATQPMHRWKVAWEAARKRAKVSCRFHDLRHTFISRLAESQASDSTVMALAGHVSRAMMERYSHIRMEAKRRAVDTLSGTDFEPGVAQNWAQFYVSEKFDGSNSLETKSEPPRTRTWNPLIKSQLLYQLS
jgi:integrase